jgi:hypothetical protein
VSFSFEGCGGGGGGGVGSLVLDEPPDESPDDPAQSLLVYPDDELERFPGISAKGGEEKTLSLDDSLLQIRNNDLSSIMCR